MSDMFSTFEICDGNPGCIAFVNNAIRLVTDVAGKDAADEVVEKLFVRMKLNFITGDKLYMLWNDCLERNTDDALIVMLADTIESINEHINYERGRGIPYTQEELESLRHEAYIDSVVIHELNRFVE